jgi:spermidine/putrescine transport system substrate-binding protein
MNFYYEPENAARIAAYVNYITPVAGAQAAMEKIDPSMVNNEAIFPTDATLSRVKTFMALSDAQQASFTDQFSTLSGA